MNSAIHVLRSQIAILGVGDQSIEDAAAAARKPHVRITSRSDADATPKCENACTAFFRTREPAQRIFHARIRSSTTPEGRECRGCRDSRGRTTQALLAMGSSALVTRTPPSSAISTL